MQKKAIKVNPTDNVIVALVDLKANEIVVVDNAEFQIQTQNTNLLQ